MTLAFSNCRLNPASRELSRDGELVSIEPKAFDLLLYLVRNRDRAVGKDELQDKVWGTIVTDAALARAVMKLRKAIGDRAGSTSIIKTVPRFGYRFVAELDEGDRADAGPGSAPERRGIAVLPLVNMSGDPDNLYFSDGVAEEILNLLAKLPQLRVASRTSSFAFRDSNKTVGEIADALDVGIVLEGSVRRSGDRVRVAMQLIDARDDSHLWSEIYDRKLTDIFSVQADIAREVVSAMGGGEAGNIRHYKATDDARAYDYYLRGLQLYHLMDRGCMSRARQMFEQAIDIDPHYAKAWAGLANAASMTYMWYERAGELLELSDRASRRALELAPNLAESHTARAFALTLLGSFEAATAEFERALALDPQLYEAWYLYARSCFAEGKLAEAVRLFELAGRVRPDDYQSFCLAATACKAMGDSLRLKPLAQEAVRRAERHLMLNPEDTRALTLGGSCLSDIGEHERGVQWVERAIAIAPEDIGVLHNGGCFFAATGNVDRALDLFERRLELGDIYQEWIDNDSDFDSIRDNPRFLAMLKNRR
jgi:adenylate cyclase